MVLSTWWGQEKILCRLWRSFTLDIREFDIFLRLPLFLREENACNNILTEDVCTIDIYNG